MSAIDKFSELKVGALFMEMGTGKTRAALEILATTDVMHIFYICPHSTKENTLAEINKWNCGRQNIEVITYEQLSMSDKFYLNLMSRVKIVRKIGIIADESIFIKNDDTKRFKRVMQLASHSEYRLILNGTPLTKNEFDIYNQMQFLSPKILKMNREQFLNTFFKRVRYKRKGESIKEFYELSDVNLNYLHALIEPYIFQHKFEFIQREYTTSIQISANDYVYIQYDELKERVLESIKQNESFLDTLVLMQKLVFCDELRCKEIAKQISGQAIVYCSFLKEVEYISKNCDCYVITGETTAVERVSILNKFKNDNKPLIMTYGVGSYGLNLQYCNKMYFASIPFDYGKITQAEARIRRIGQTRDIEYIYFTSALGIYSLIKKCIDKKQLLNELVIEKIKEVI